MENLVRAARRRRNRLRGLPLHDSKESRPRDIRPARLKAAAILNALRTPWDCNRFRMARWKVYFSAPMSDNQGVGVVSTSGPHHPGNVHFRPRPSLRAKLMNKDGVVALRSMPRHRWAFPVPRHQQLAPVYSLPHVLDATFFRLAIWRYFPKRAQADVVAHEACSRKIHEPTILHGFADDIYMP